MRSLTVVFSLGVILVLVYLGSYLSFRHSHIEIWEQNQHAYVIFPQNSRLLYYAYRPFVYIDAKLTGMRFHIGAHHEEIVETK